MSNKVKILKPEIEKLLENNHSPAEICKILQIKTGSLSSFLHKHNMVYKGKNKNTPQYHSEKIIQLAKEGKTPIEIATTLNLKYPSVGSFLQVRGFKYQPNQGNIRYFENIDTHIKSYFLGFITADGCLQNNGSNSFGLSITIHSKDRSIVDKLKEEIGCENKILHLTTNMTHNQKPKDHVRFALFNKLLYSDLCKYGLAPRKSTTMPNIIPNIPKEFRKSFILGYLDGDGSVNLPKKGKTKMTKKGLKTYPNNQIIVSFRGTEAFLNGVVEELNIKNYSLFKDKQRNCWTLSITKRIEVLNFFEIYKNNNFYLKRKHNKFLERIHQVQTISSSL